MDFDLIDAQGSAVIMQDGGKAVTLLLPTGVSLPVNVFIDHETVVTPSGYDNFTTEQRVTITALLDDLPNQAPAPVGAIFIAGNRRYIVDNTDSEAAVDSVTAVHVVRAINGQ